MDKLMEVLNNSEKELCVIARRLKKEIPKKAEAFNLYIKVVDTLAEIRMTLSKFENQ